VNKFPANEDREEEIRFEKEIEINGEAPDFSYQHETRSLRQESQINKLNHRITLLSILVPCLLGAILVFAYLEFENRLDNIGNIRSKEVESLSEDMGERLESLSNQYRELEKSLSDRLSALQKSTASIEKDLKGNQQEIRRLTLSKADKNALQQLEKKQSAEAAKAMGALQNELRDQNRAVENLNGTLKKEVARIVNVLERVEKDGQKQASTIKDLSVRKLDKEEFGNILENKWSGYQATISLLQKSMESLNERVSQLQREVNTAVTRSKAPETKRTPTGERPAAARDTLIPVPGKIVEQEITE